MENNNSENLRVGFHSIEMLLKLSPENIKQIFIPANRNDDRALRLISMAEKLSVSIERKKSLTQHPEAILKTAINLGLGDLKNYEESIQHNNPTFLVIDNVIEQSNQGACIRYAEESNIAGENKNKQHCTPINEKERQESEGGTEERKKSTVTN